MAERKAKPFVKSDIDLSIIYNAQRAIEKVTKSSKVEESVKVFAELQTALTQVGLTPIVETQQYNWDGVSAGYSFFELKETKEHGLIFGWFKLPYGSQIWLYDMFII